MVKFKIIPGRQTNINYVDAEHGRKLVFVTLGTTQKKLHGTGTPHIFEYPLTTLLLES